MTIVGQAGKRRFQFSLWSLLAATAAMALLLVPVVWVARERQEVLRAREEAVRAVILAERQRAASQNTGPAIPTTIDRLARGRPTSQGTPLPSDVSALVEQLQRENAELKATVERLRSEVDQLKAASRP
jgi:hypothetical protein